MKCTSLSTARYIIGTAPKGIHPSIGRFGNKSAETPKAVEPVVEESPAEKPAAIQEQAETTEETPTSSEEPVKKTTKRASKKKA